MHPGGASLFVIPACARKSKNHAQQIYGAHGEQAGKKGTGLIIKIAENEKQKAVVDKRRQGGSGKNRKKGEKIDECFCKSHYQNTADDFASEVKSVTDAFAGDRKNHCLHIAESGIHAGSGVPEADKRCSVGKNHSAMENTAVEKKKDSDHQKA